MRRGAIVVTAVTVALAGLAGPARSAERRTAGRAAAAGSAPVTIVGPTDANGSVMISGSATVNGTVEAAQSGPWAVGQSGSWTVGQAGSWTVGQAGAWTVGLDTPASTALSNIDAATAGLRYDDDGSLKVSVAGGPAANPSLANRLPFGLNVSQSIPGNDSVTMNAAYVYNVTAYSFFADRDMVAVFLRGGSGVFAIRIPAGQSLTGSFPNAIPADGLQLQCRSGDTCSFLSAVAAYE